MIESEHHSHLETVLRVESLQVMKAMFLLPYGQWRKELQQQRDAHRTAKTSLACHRTGR